MSFNLTLVHLGQGSFFIFVMTGVEARNDLDKRPSKIDVNALFQLLDTLDKPILFY